MAPRLIAFTGGDGSGKSTQIELLSSHLRNNGVSVHVAWCRWKPVIPRPFLFVLKKSVFRKTATRDYNVSHADRQRFSKWQQTKRTLFRSPLLRNAYLQLALFDYTLQLVFKIVPYLIVGRTVLADRYLIDLFVDQGLNFGYDSIQMVDLTRRKRPLLLPNPALTIYLDVPPEVAMTRKNDIPSLEYLEQLQAAYSAISTAEGYTRIDASKPIDEIHEEIVKRVNSVLPPPAQ